jgi:uncharacterized Zn-binding protein involved in type VI secretion
MSGEIIRLGDPTSHGGKVLEGSQTDICHGKPIAYVGHQTSCPKCKGTYPIIEGALTTTFYGKGVALAGMKTACGATLIATQFTDIVEYGGGTTQSSHAGKALATILATAPLAAALADSEADAHEEMAGQDSFDLFFVVKDEKTGEVMADTPYKITMEDGCEVVGITDHAGHTEKVCSHYAQQATIEVPYYDHCDTDSGSQSDACGC